MIDPNILREEPDRVRTALKNRNMSTELVESFLSIDTEWRRMKTAQDELRAAQKKLGAGDRDEARRIKDAISADEERVASLETERAAILDLIPNIPANDVPVGPDESGNVVLRQVGEKPDLGASPKDYLALARGLIDTERAARTSGSRFGYLFGEAVLLEFALIEHALSLLVAKGFTPVVPPVMIKPEVYRGMGRLVGDQKEERYYLASDDLYLVGSSEHTVGPLHMGETLDEATLPRRYVAFSTCFRREAGSYGKDTKGILRVHQFDKVEMFSFSDPEKSEEEHLFLLARQEELIGSLGLPYQVVQICTGDMGTTDYKQYDIETWLPGQGRYRETNSCSNTTEYQARGINARFRRAATGKTELLHMLNATGYAIGRVLIAIIENYQRADGSIAVPEVLQHYLGTDHIIPR